MSSKTTRLTAALLTLIVALIGGIWSGLVAVALWGWFVVPLGLPMINVPHAMGLALMLAILLGSRGIISDIEHLSMMDKWEKFGSQLAFSFVLPTLGLGVGWVVHILM